MLTPDPADGGGHAGGGVAFLQPAMFHQRNPDRDSMFKQVGGLQEYYFTTHGRTQAPLTQAWRPPGVCTAVGIPVRWPSNGRADRFQGSKRCGDTTCSTQARGQ
jgi:hypothetical protein